MWVQKPGGVNGAVIACTSVQVWPDELGDTSGGDS